ncbi:MAG: hypothetical protein GY797_05240 [Deltaproteobacteria bacterium]|nr:hypothetical protein [Deltaproteobacteria bacterium]
MKLQTLIEELERQTPLKWDRRINSSRFEMVLSENQVGLQINGNNHFSITNPCHSQIAERLEIPTRYYHKMESDKQCCGTLPVERDTEGKHPYGLWCRTRTFLGHKPIHNMVAQKRGINFQDRQKSQNIEKFLSLFR